jgi:UDP-N-acetyl-D-mannosaminuronic acid dehydrogenase
VQRGAPFERDIVVIGGCGHVGLPLAIAFADRGSGVAVYDTNPAAVDLVSSGTMPFAEQGAGPLLQRAVARGQLAASADPAVVGSAEHVVVVIGTPVDEHLNPDQQAIPRVLEACAPHLRDGVLPFHS